MVSIHGKKDKRMTILVPKELREKIVNASFSLSGTNNASKFIIYAIEKTLEDMGVKV